MLLLNTLSQRMVVQFFTVLSFYPETSKVTLTPRVSS